MERKSEFSGRRRRSQRRRCRPCTYQSLEPRRLLAGIFFNSANGDVTVAGDSGNDQGAAVLVDANTLRVSLSGFASQDFDPAVVQRLVFIGLAGDDEFSNQTDIPSAQYGGDGQDRLIGGSDSDVLNGGNGQDHLEGGDGDDRIYGGLDNDVIFGGAGNDRLFGGGGGNQIEGQAGDDLIFGGELADTIDGGDGRDQIFGLEGDDLLFSGDGGTPGTPGIDQADLILGLAGDDTITGGAGLNVFYGGDGNDTLIAGSGQHRLHGQAGDDVLTGGEQADYLAGHAGNDILQGLGGNDFLVPGTGQDTVSGGSGVDFASYAGLYRQYRINGSGDLRIRDMRDVAGNEGTDFVDGLEQLRFGDGDQPAVSPIVEQLTIQPIVVSNTNGSNTAVFFGSTTVATEIMERIDDIYYQANVDLVWNTANSWNNTFANEGNGGNRPNSDLTTVTQDGDQAGVGSPDTRVVDMYFVNIAAGFDQTNENTANGLAFIGLSGITIHIGDQLLGFDAGLDVIARVSAHEIAHNLGLVHVNASGNLMDRGTNLNASQIATILASPMTVPI